MKTQNGNNVWFLNKKSYVSYLSTFWLLINNIIQNKMLAKIIETNKYNKIFLDMLFLYA